MADLIQNIPLLIRKQKFRFLCIGGINTLFGYAIGLILYYTLYQYLHLILITIPAQILGITFSFCTYKLFVFKTKGNWLQEYLRCYAVYGLNAIIGIFITWVLVDLVHLPFWLVQGLLIGITVVISYIGHSRFSFAPVKKKNNMQQSVLPETIAQTAAVTPPEASPNPSEIPPIK